MEYTFDDQYPDTNMELFGENGGNPGAAILITTSPGSVGMPGDMNEDEALNVLGVNTKNVKEVLRFHDGKHP